MLLPREFIKAKRDGEELTPESIKDFVDGIARGQVSDAQIGAFAMAVCFQNMSMAEQSALTLAMRDSGHCLQWPDLDGPVLDKHSTGGVGDLVSLYTHTVRIGRTSITIKVEVEAERRGSQSRGPQRTVVKVTEAEVVFVQVDENNRPIPIERGATGTEAGES